MNFPVLETAVNEYTQRDYQVHIEFPEFTCLCPRTGLPDFANIIIDYHPNKKLVELKSLKYYFVAWRNVGIFHEHAVNQILDAFVAACSPRQVKITGEFAVRGGIRTTVTAEYSNQ